MLAGMVNAMEQNVDCCCGSLHNLTIYDGLYTTTLTKQFNFKIYTVAFWVNISELFSFDSSFKMIQGNTEKFSFQVVAMASISISASPGSFTAWMQVLAGFGDGINYFQKVRLSLSLGGMHLHSYLCIYFVHRRKVFHIFQIDIDFDNLLPWCTCCQQDVFEIRDALSLWKIRLMTLWRLRNNMFIQFAL